MCSLKPLFRFVLVALIICGSQMGYAAEAVKQQGKIKKMLADRYHDKYREIIHEERERRDKSRMVQNGVAGGISFLVGTYGYFTDRSGTVARFVYGLTQSAGIAVAGSAYMEYNSPSLLLLVDKELRKKEQISDENYERLIVMLDERRQVTQYKSYAISATVLTLLNGYNGLREKKSSPTLSNVFYFLSFNFSLVAGFSYYKWATINRFSLDSDEASNIELAVLPYPTVTYRF